MATLTAAEDTDFTVQPGYVRFNVSGSRIRVWEKAGSNYSVIGDIPEESPRLDSGVAEVKITEASTVLKWAALAGSPTVVATQTTA